MNFQVEIDWSIDENRRNLRKVCCGHERSLASSLLSNFVLEFDQKYGPGLYSSWRFIDFLAEEHPAALAGFAGRLLDERDWSEFPNGKRDP